MISPNFIAPAEPSQASNCRGSLHVREDGGSKEPAEPHTATGAVNDGEHVRQRVLAVKLDFRNNEDEYQRLKELSRQASRYFNHQALGRWAEATGLCVDPKKGIPHDVTKKVRAEKKEELSGSAYSAVERELNGSWSRHLKLGLDTVPLPSRKPTSALVIRGNKNKNESGVRLSLDEKDRFIVQLQAQSATCDGGSWFEIPAATGTVKDYQAELLRKMVSWEVPILKASVIIKPMRHTALVRLCYAVKTPLLKFGNRVATLGPIDRGKLFLRTECETRDFSGRLHTLLERKEDWDGIRRRALSQIGRRKGSARAKRKLLAKMSWEDWLKTFMHNWSAEMVTWLHGQGIGSLNVIGLETADWPAFKFTELLKYKGENVGMSVSTAVDLAEPATMRSVKQEIAKRRRRATKAGKAIRELGYQSSGK